MPQQPTLKIVEIFPSLQGEGLRQGEPTIFVRLAGCNLRCSFCDTKRAWGRGRARSVPDIMAEVVHAIEKESAVTLTDFMIRRSLIAFRQCEGLDCCTKVAKKMGAILQWSSRKVTEQVNAYKKEIAMRHAYEKREQPKPAPKRSRKPRRVRRRSTRRQG